LLFPFIGASVVLGALSVSEGGPIGWASFVVWASVALLLGVRAFNPERRKVESRVSGWAVGLRKPHHPLGRLLKPEYFDGGALVVASLGGLASAALLLGGAVAWTVGLPAVLMFLTVAGFAGLMALQVHWYTLGAAFATPLIGVMYVVPRWLVSQSACVAREAAVVAVLGSAATVVLSLVVHAKATRRRALSLGVASTGGGPATLGAGHLDDAHALGDGEAADAGSGGQRPASLRDIGGANGAPATPDERPNGAEVRELRRAEEVLGSVAELTTGTPIERRLSIVYGLEKDGALRFEPSHHRWVPATHAFGRWLPPSITIDGVAEPPEGATKG